ncbi:MAG: queuosine salvage family protein [Patescibacteria group bacterium]|jgi:hypothetical protein
MQSILDSIQSVIKNSRFVRINPEAIRDFAASVTDSDFGGSEWNEETLLKSGHEETYIASAFLISALAFCYWGEPKWTIDVRGQTFDGNAAMLRALKRGIDDGYPLTDPRYLSNLPEDDLRQILKGSIEIPLFAERLRLLRDMGKIVTENFSGSFKKIVEAADYDALKLVEVAVNAMPTVFDDQVNYHGQKILFYKRAQVIPLSLHGLAELKLVPPIQNFDQLTALADYKGPQLLRKLGILQYTDDLAAHINAKIEIASGSDEEIEIRANEIWAIELLTRAIQERLPDICPIEVFECLWLRGQTKSADDKPYHRTRTIWY